MARGGNPIGNELIMTSATLQAPVHKPGAFSIWLQAIRPATLPAAVAPVVLGAAAAKSDGVFSMIPVLAALIGALLIQIGTNLANDYFDFKKGADTADRLGPIRVTQRGWIAPKDVARATIVTFLLALATGVYLMVHGGIPILILGIVSILCGVLYTGGPAPLAYVGLGDIFVLVFFGPVAVCGTYYVQCQALSWNALWVSLPIGLLTTAILVVNNLRDRNTDAIAGKKTWAVRFGERFTRGEYLFLIGAAYAVPVVMVAMELAPMGWLLPLLSAPLASRRVGQVLTTDGAALNPLLGATARLGLIYSALFAVGVNL